MSKNLPLHQNLSYMLELSEILESMEAENKTLRETIQLLERTNAEKDKMIENLQQSICQYEKTQVDYRVYAEHLMCEVAHNRSVKHRYNYGFELVQRQTAALNNFMNNASKYFKITEQEVKEAISNDNFEKVYVYAGTPKHNDYTLFGMKQSDLQQLEIESQTLSQPIMPSPDFSHSDTMPLLDVFEPPIIDDTDEIQTEPKIENVACIFCDKTMSLEENLDSCHHCKKYFHEKCFSEWLIDNSACPDCRKPVPLEQEDKYLKHIFH